VTDNDEYKIAIKVPREAYEEAIADGRLTVVAPCDSAEVLAEFCGPGVAPHQEVLHAPSAPPIIADIGAVPANALGPHQAAVLDASALADEVAPKPSIHDALEHAAEPLSDVAMKIARPRLSLFSIANWEARIWLRPHRTGEFLVIHCRVRVVPADFRVKAGTPETITEEAHAKMGWEALASDRGGELLASAAIELAGVCVGRTVTRLVDAGMMPRELPATDGKACAKCGAANPMPQAIRWTCALCGEINAGPIADRDPGDEA
jgi:hypothetical protein